MSLAFCPFVIAEVGDFEHAIEQVPDSQLLGAVAIVVRVHAKLWFELMSPTPEFGAALAEQGRLVATRAPKTDVFAVPDGSSFASGSPAYVARHGPRLLFEASTGTAPFHEVSAEMVHAIRERDLSLCVEESRARCVICASESHHFSLPSGAHASQFLRLAEAFVSMEAVDRVAYWVALEMETVLQPLSGNTRRALVVDHPSMLILAARVQCLVSSPLEVVCFKSYPSDVETRTASFELLGQLAERNSTGLVLIGVASSGRLARFINQWMTEAAGGSRFASRVLFALQPVRDVQYLCLLALPDYEHYADADSCNLCIRESSVVAIQSSNYMVGHGPAINVAVPPTLFAEQRAFLERWGAFEGVLRVHYDDPNESTARHHAFYVDIATLLVQTEFQEEVISHVQGLNPQPDVVIVPDHPAATAIAKLLSARLHISQATLNSTSYVDSSSESLDALRAARTLLVIDDVFISGSRFDSINRFLREHGAQYCPDVVAVHYVTLLATPSSGVDYERRQRGLVGNHKWVATLSHLYKFALPNWHSTKDCPWCKERAVLTQLAQSAGELDGVLAERLSVLNDTRAGLELEAYFVHETVGALPRLGSNSTLLSEGATPLQVLFACASAIQQLRHKTTAALGADRFPVPSHLAVRVFSVNFTERIIWLGLLRSLRASELEQALKAFLRDSALRRGDENHALIAAEMAVAWVVGKLESIPASNEACQFFESVGIEWQALFRTALVDARTVDLSE